MKHGIHLYIPILLVMGCTQTSSVTSTENITNNDMFPVAVGEWWLYDYQTEYTEYRILENGADYVKRSHLDGELGWEIDNRDRNLYSLKVMHDMVQYDSVKVDGILIWVDTLSSNGVNYYTIKNEAETYTIEYSFPPSYFNPGLDMFTVAVDRFVDPSIIAEDIFQRSTDMFQDFWIAKNGQRLPSLYAHNGSNVRIRGNVTDMYEYFTVPSVGIVLLEWEKHVSEPSPIQYDVIHRLNLLRSGTL